MDESNRVLAVLNYGGFESFEREAWLTRLPRLHTEPAKPSSENQAATVPYAPSRRGGRTRAVRPKQQEMGCIGSAPWPGAGRAEGCRWSVAHRAPAAVVVAANSRRRAVVSMALASGAVHRLRIPGCLGQEAVEARWVDRLGKLPMDAPPRSVLLPPTRAFPGPAAYRLAPSDRR